MTEKDKESNGDAEWVPEWYPKKFRLPNMVEETVREESPYYRRIMLGMLMVEQRIQIKGIFSEPLELHDFPLDC